MSKLFRINLPDVIKGFCISAAAGLFISISNALSSGMLPDMIHLKRFAVFSLHTGCVYVIKNFFTNSEGKFAVSEPKKD